ncbi:MAG: HK97 gp10 family phage protein [Polyangiales bacterium]
MTPGIDLDLRAWLPPLRGLGAALDDELERAAREGAKVVAFAAKADHPYTDRSETLTRSIRAYAPRGSFLRDTLDVDIIARAAYAKYLERRRAWAFLGPALERSQGRLEHLLYDALEAAVRRSGLG